MNVNNKKTTAVVYSKFDFSGLSKKSYREFNVYFKLITDKDDLYGIGFRIEFSGPKLKNELESIFKLSSDLKKYLESIKK